MWKNWRSLKPSLRNMATMQKICYLVGKKMERRQVLLIIRQRSMMRTRMMLLFRRQIDRYASMQYICLYHDARFSCTHLIFRCINGSVVLHSGIHSSKSSISSIHSLWRLERK
uniref:Uncharacterized protein n=1 Tax=Opuntia streptacantha TaxID=393608 RepID=A0A7C9AV16_OPUST